MNHTFADITFTPEVMAQQVEHGSREAYANFAAQQNAASAFTTRESEFIASRDSFYQATVSETGWPYVQHRGGPEGFLKVLDEQTLGYADFSGNRQYISAGNLANNDRIALIMVDYASRRRLKILGRVRILKKGEEPAIFTRLVDKSYPAQIERAYIIQLEAYDWNCPSHITPRHITPRYKEAER